MNNSIEAQLKDVLKKVLDVSDDDANKITEKYTDDLEKVRLLVNMNFLRYT